MARELGLDILVHMKPSGVVSRECWWQEDQLAYARSKFPGLEFPVQRDVFGTSLEGAHGYFLSLPERQVLESIKWDEVSQ